MKNFGGFRGGTGDLQAREPKESDISKIHYSGVLQPSLLLKPVFWAPLGVC